MGNLTKGDRGFLKAKMILSDCRGSSRPALLLKRTLIGAVLLLVAGSAALTAAQPGQSEVRVKIGVASADITPFLDVPLAGYYYPRMPVGVHDDLHAKALVIDNGREQIVLVACDLVKVPREAVEDARRRIKEKFGIPADHVLISADHSHTGPQATPDYVKSLGHRIADSVETAESRKLEANLFAGAEDEPSLPHNRRYLMKDGSVATNPGFLNPNVVRPMGPIDPRIAVLFAKDDQSDPLMTWVNYAMHQDTVGGDLISADYSYFLASTLAMFEGPDMLTIFTIGAAGDINHWNIHQPGPQRASLLRKESDECWGPTSSKRTPI